MNIHERRIGHDIESNMGMIYLFAKILSLEEKVARLEEALGNESV
jgi:hypothetical protein